MPQKRSPATRWSKMHRGGSFIARGNKWKMSYRSPEGAEYHAADLNRRYPERGRWCAYPCRWGEDYRTGETAPEHWHVGREPTS